MLKNQKLATFFSHYYSVLVVQIETGCYYWVTLSQPEAWGHRLWSLFTIYNGIFLYYSLWIESIRIEMIKENCNTQMVCPQILISGWHFTVISFYFFFICLFWDLFNAQRFKVGTRLNRFADFVVVVVVIYQLMRNSDFKIKYHIHVIANTYQR